MNLKKTIKQQYFEERSRENKYIREIPPCDIIFTKFKTNFIKAMKQFDNKMTCENNINKMQEIYEQYKETHQRYIFSYLCEHWKISQIFSFVKGEIKVTLDTTLEDVRTQMLEKINNILDIELNKYIELEDYNILEELLVAIKKTHAITCLWGAQNIEITKFILKRRINYIVNSYYKRKKLVEELIEYEGEVTPNIQNLYNNILDEEAFYNTYNTLDKPSILKRIRKKLTRG